MKKIIIITGIMFFANLLFVNYSFATPPCIRSEPGEAEKLLKESGLDAKFNIFEEFEYEGNCSRGFTLSYKIPDDYSKLGIEYKLYIEKSDFKYVLTTLQALPGDLKVLLNKIEDDKLIRYLLTDIIKAKTGSISNMNPYAVNFIGENDGGLLIDLFTGRVIRIDAKTTEQARAFEQIFPFVKTIQNQKIFKEISVNKTPNKLAIWFPVAGRFSHYKYNNATYYFADNTNIYFLPLSATSSALSLSVGGYIDTDIGKIFEYEEKDKYFLDEESTLAIYAAMDSVVFPLTADQLLDSGKPDTRSEQDLTDNGLWDKPKNLIQQKFFPITAVLLYFIGVIYLFIRNKAKHKKILKK